MFKFSHPLFLSLIICTTLLLTSTHAIAQKPNLKNQSAWTEADKKAFLQYLESGKQAPIFGNVNLKNSDDGEPLSEQLYNFNFAKAKYINVSALTNSMYTIGSDNVRHTISHNMGAKILVGGHIFTWVRFYFGVQYSALDQTMKNGQKARLNHYEVPAGFELALIPLGTPQTRYVILRGGASAHYIDGNKKDSDFDNSLLGYRGTWNLGLGYEWQIPNTSWRFNTLLEGFRSISKEEGSKFTGAGLTTGMVYTF